MAQGEINPEAFEPKWADLGLWVIHGRFYQLDEFVDKHPGGTRMISLGRGRDCTELFESIHVFSKLDLKKILAKYEVDTKDLPPDLPPAVEKFAWEENGFYSVCKKRVAEYFEKNGGNYKATTWYWIKLCLMLIAIGVLYRNAIYNLSLFSAFLAGIIMNMVGFCFMHDGSHGSLSKNPRINDLFLIWANWNLWSHFVWLRHHVFGHHSFTSVFPIDPDLTNTASFVRKHEDVALRKIHSVQSNSAWFVFMLFPNQHLGQAAQYLLAYIIEGNHIYGLTLEPQPFVDKFLSAIIFVMSGYVHMYYPFTLGNPFLYTLVIVLTYWVSIGIGYFLNVLPNHDTIDTWENIHARKGDGPVDWGELQVRGSGDHSNDGGIWSTIVTELWGGMNYQIEHHLFPAVSHVHYPAIGKIVRQTAKEFNIPYVSLSWWRSITKYYEFLKLLQTEEAKKLAEARKTK